MDSNNCILCDKEDIGYGNNPSPLLNEGRCCDDCNEKFILEYRIILMSMKQHKELNKKSNKLKLLSYFIDKVNTKAKTDKQKRQNTINILKSYKKK